MVNTPSDYWAKVDYDGPLSILGTPCWLFTGRIDAYGYGVFNIWGQRWKAHRLAFVLTHGHVPELLDHLCVNPRCVRPSHLQGVTQAVNAARRHLPRTGPRL